MKLIKYIFSTKVSYKSKECLDIRLRKVLCMNALTIYQLYFESFNRYCSSTKKNYFLRDKTRLEVRLGHPKRNSY